MVRNRSASDRAYREKNKDRIKAYRNKWRAENPTYGKEWYAANKHLYKTRYKKPCAAS